MKLKTLCYFRVIIQKVVEIYLGATLYGEGNIPSIVNL